jgi:hypothetical protein
MFCNVLGAVFTDEELDALLDRSDMLPAVESSVTRIDSKIKEDVKIYRVVDKPHEDLKLNNLS